MIEYPSVGFVSICLGARHPEPSLSNFYMKNTIKLRKVNKSNDCECSSAANAVYQLVEIEGAKMLSRPRNLAYKLEISQWDITGNALVLIVSSQTRMSYCYVSTNARERRQTISVPLDCTKQY